MGLSAKAFGLSWLFNQPQIKRIIGGGLRKIMFSSSFFQKKENHQVVRRARPSSPNDPTFLLSTQLPEFNPATPENKIKACITQIRLRPIEIANQLGDPPFGLVHRRLPLSFSIVVFWIIGRHSSTSRNCSAIHRLLLFTANLIFFFRAQHTGTKSKDKTFWQVIERVRVHDFPQTPNT
ncbi:hypothetical protein H5410_063887 [Solanum commersonii]|uniref:Uncharacterized protein n=1 Tax=Solanum commersonii TaxID=4109 RepID=A0A9J5WEF9_SOLCO|nr:hypothetical protein H5410_063887 [Solanum commersonii]